MNEREPINETDIYLARLRQEVAIAMMLTGRLGAEAGMALFDAATDPATLEEERRALESLESDPEHFDYEDSPFGRMGALYFRLPPNKDISDSMNE